MKFQIVFAITTTLTSQLVQAGNVFQDNFNSASTFTNQWNVSTAGNGGTATVQNGKLIITNVGGSDGYMGKGDGINLMPKNIFTAQSNNVSFSISTKEISRLRTNGYKDNSGVGLELKPSSSSNDNISIGIYGNYSGYHPDPAKPGWTYYNTYNGHSIRISSSVNGTYYLHNINELDLNALYDFDFKLEQVSGNWFARYKRSSSTTWTSVQIPTEKSPAFASEFVPRIGVWSGDGGYTRQNGSVNVEIDNVLFTEQSTTKPVLKQNWQIPAVHYCSTDGVNTTNRGLTSKTCFNNIKGATIKVFEIGEKTRMNILVNPTNQKGGFFFKMTYPSALQVSGFKIVNSEPIPVQENGEVAEVLLLVADEAIDKALGAFNLPFKLIKILYPINPVGDPSFLELLPPDSVLSKELYPYQTIERHFQRPGPGAAITIQIDSDVPFTQFKKVMDLQKMSFYIGSDINNELLVDKLRSK